MPDDVESLVRRLHLQELRAAVEQPSGQSVRMQGTPVAEVPTPPEDHPLAGEWRTFIQSVDRLIAEGQRGRFALVKEGRPLSVWDTLRDAVQAAQLLWGQEPSLVQEIQPFVRPLFRGPRGACQV